MPVQKQHTRKNYIGVLNDIAEDERVADDAAQSRSGMMGDWVRRLAAVLGRSRKGPTISP